MSFYLSSSVFDLTEGKERDITHSYYEIAEPENDSEDFPIFRNPIFQEANPIFQEFENFFPIEHTFILNKKSETKNVESTKIKSKKNKKERISFKRRGSTGRKRKITINSKQNNEIKEKEKFHDKNIVDNLKKKIQVHYMSFIRSFLNEIIKQLKIVRQFLKIDYNIKKNVHKNNLNELKEKTIGEIISSEISPKYKNNEKNYNKIIVDDLSKNEVLRNILSQNYMSFFKEVYYKSNNKINLKRYGADEEIILSNKVEMYKDFLKNKDFDFIHIMGLNRCVAKYFYPELIFLVNYN
jgi:hypothetical protein